ncbi:hypothetical protein D210916BOD24_25160 [Alteromonas sp. D210916BOD_24]|uniref:hypothetical protein n=1 Tax=Alteromonas sp. D210916BOD_24 TaxID=3157618 RepID=UPI00399C5A04
MTSIRNVSNEVRFGNDNGNVNPTLVSDYLRGVNCTASLLQQDKDKFSVYFHALEIMVSSIWDQDVDVLWRQCLFDNLYIPLLAAERHATNQNDRIALAKLKINMHTQTLAL